MSLATAMLGTRCHWASALESRRLRLTLILLASWPSTTRRWRRWSSTLTRFCSPSRRGRSSHGSRTLMLDQITTILYRPRFVLVYNSCIL